MGPPRGETPFPCLPPDSERAARLWTSRPWTGTSYRVSGGIRLEIKCLIAHDVPESSQNHPYSSWSVEKLLPTKSVIGT